MWCLCGVTGYELSWGPRHFLRIVTTFKLELSKPIMRYGIVFDAHQITRGDEFASGHMQNGFLSYTLNTRDLKDQSCCAENFFLSRKMSYDKKGIPFKKN